MTCLLDQSITPEQHFRVVNGLRKSGWLDYNRLENTLIENPTKLKTDLREALKHYRFPNKATKAIITNVGKIDKDYKGNLHNIFAFAKEEFGQDNQKVALAVWKRVNEFYWYGIKKSGLFIHELVNQGLWDLALEELPIPPDSRVRRVMFRLGLTKKKDDLKEVVKVANELAKKAKISPLELDCALWTIGDKSICGESKAFCEKCPFDFCCPKVVTK